MSFSAANRCTAAALPGPHKIGFDDAAGEQPVFVGLELVGERVGDPRNRATGLTWMVSADELSTTVWPRATWARTSSRISG